MGIGSGSEGRAEREYEDEVWEGVGIGGRWARCGTERVERKEGGRGGGGREGVRILAEGRKRG